MGGPKAVAAAATSPGKFSAQVALSILAQVLRDSCPGKFSAEQVVGARPLSNLSKQVLKFSQQVALSKLLARVALSKFSKQALCVSCSEYVLGASSSEEVRQASSLCKLLL